MVNLLYKDWGQDIRGPVCVCVSVCASAREDPIYWYIAIANQCLWVDKKKGDRLYIFVHC